MHTDMAAADVLPSQRHIVAHTAGRVSLEKLGYQWSDDGASLTVRLPLLEPAELTAIDFGDAACSVRLKGLGSQTEYFWNVDTFGTLRGEACSVKVRKERVVLRLEKREEQPWPRLRR